MSIQFDVTDLSNMDENKIFAVRVDVGNLPPRIAEKHILSAKNALMPIINRVKELGGHVIFIPVRTDAKVKMDVLEKQAIEDIAELISKHGNYEKAMKVVS